MVIRLAVPNLAALDRAGALMPRVRREPFPLILVKRPLSLFRRGFEIRLINRDGDILDTVTVDSSDEADRAAESLHRWHRGQDGMKVTPPD